MDRRLEATLAPWRERLDVIPIKLPPCARAFEESLRASIAWILVNRAGVRIQPGTRCYRRSWIRDGTLTGTALAEMGFVVLPVTGAHAERLASLPLIHKDPFDRMLVAQSLAEPLVLLTNDGVLADYGDVVKVV